MRSLVDIFVAFVVLGSSRRVQNSSEDGLDVKMNDLQAHTSHSINFARTMLSLSSKVSESGSRLVRKNHLVRKHKSRRPPAMVTLEDCTVPNVNNNDPSSIERRKAIVAAMAGLCGEAAWRKAVGVAADAMETINADNILPPEAIKLIEAGRPVVIPNWISKEEVRELVADIKDCLNKDGFLDYGAALGKPSGRSIMPSFNFKSGGSHIPPLASIEQDESDGPFANPDLGNFEVRQKFKARMAEMRVQLAKQLKDRPTLANDFRHTHEIEYLYYTPNADITRHLDDRHIELKIPNASRLAKKENPSRRSVTWLVYLNENWDPEEHGGQMRFYVRDKPPDTYVGARGADLQVGWLQAFGDMGEQPVFLDTGVESQPGVVNGILYTLNAEGQKRHLSQKPFVIYELKDKEAAAQLSKMSLNEIGAAQKSGFSKFITRSLRIDDTLDAARFRCDLPPQFLEDLPKARGGYPLATSFKGESQLDIYPDAGTLVVFDSVSLPHEVIKTYRERMAIQGWFHEKLYSA